MHGKVCHKPTHVRHLGDARGLGTWVGGVDCSALAGVEAAPADRLARMDVRTWGKNRGLSAPAIVSVT